MDERKTPMMQTFCIDFTSRAGFANTVTMTGEELSWFMRTPGVKINFITAQEGIKDDEQH